MRLFTLLCFVPLISTGISAQSHLSTYGWPNTPCTGAIHCNNGCSACNMAVNSGPSLLGAGSSWLGVDLCPHPMGGADNALHVSGWTGIATANHQGLLSWFVTAPLQVDSVVIRHRGTTDGPGRLRIIFSPSADMPLQEVDDVAIPNTWTTTVLTDLGCIAPASGMSFAQFTLGLQGYLGGSGDWIVDEVTVVASPCAAGATSIATWTGHPEGPVSSQRIDLLGRQVGGHTGQGTQGASPRVVVLAP